MPKAMTARAVARQTDQLLNHARVQAASDAATVEAAVDVKVADAVVGDLTVTNPYLAAKFTNLDDTLTTVDSRLDAIGA